MNGRAWWQFAIALPVAGVALIACGASDWDERLRERFDTVKTDHPLLNEARSSYERALTAHEADHPQDAHDWALAADRFLTAAMVEGQLRKLRTEVETLRSTFEAERQQVLALEEQLSDQFAADKRAATSRWLEEAKVEAYEHAGDYETKRFRKRNADGAKLLAARDALLELAEQQLAAARALGAAQESRGLADDLARCAAVREPMAALDCANQTRWKVQRAFLRARGKHEVSPAQVASLNARLEKSNVTHRWQNESIAIVTQNMTTTRWRGAFEELVGPVQVHGSASDVRAVRQQLLQAGLTASQLADDAVVKTGAEGFETVVYLLAYPR